MKKFLMAGLLAGSTLLASCATTPNGSTEVGNVQQIAQRVCGFLPTAETVINIIGLNNSALATATAIADAICAAVAPKMLRRKALRRLGPPTVGGVPVYGRFVK